jgi:GMP synthase (glutamine-hydrolysing)
LVDVTGRGIHAATPLPATLTKERVALARAADAIVMTALEAHGLLGAIWQCPTVLLPLCLDGQGREVVILRPVRSERAMTARPAALPARLLAAIREPLLGLPSVGRVLLDVTTKPPGTIEWE